jgi:hypothetical protein
MKPLLGSNHETVIWRDVAEGITALTLKEDTDPVILVSNGGNTGSGI